MSNPAINFRLPDRWHQSLKADDCIDVHLAATFAAAGGYYRHAQIIDRVNDEVRIHLHGCSEKCDETISINSDRIKLINSQLEPLKRQSPSINS